MVSHADVDDLGARGRWRGGDLEHVEVEADDLAALGELERLVGQVGADRERALGDDARRPTRWWRWSRPCAQPAAG